MNTYSLSNCSIKHLDLGATRQKHTPNCSAADSYIIKSSTCFIKHFPRLSLGAVVRPLQIQYHKSALSSITRHYSHYYPENWRYSSALQSLLGNLRY
ncbi:uncharacterized protein DS421_20g693300 [Arachis hypogaea]|nr:uncharacterized protein DS421_20g693300 [Arachis hypogaea]